MSPDSPAGDALWREHVLETPALDLYWYDAGSGLLTVWLNGGPGDDHSYLRPVAAPLTADFRCLLYDQRGCGKSRIEPQDETTLRPDLFVDDLDALRVHLGEERITLIGHSWGANLALLYGREHPDRIERLVLIAPGPLDAEMGETYTANNLRVLTPEERLEFEELGRTRRDAVRARDLLAAKDLHLRLIALTVRAYVYFPEAAGRFLADMRAGYNHNPLVNRLVKGTIGWEGLSGIAAPVLVIYGHQDVEPIVQAFRLRDLIPGARITLLNECGHVPWLDQPTPFYRELRAFLTSS